MPFIWDTFWIGFSYCLKHPKQFDHVHNRPTVACEKVRSIENDQSDANTA